MTHAIEIVNARVAYNGKPVLDAFSTRIREHSVVAVIGPSGTGKSTLLRTLSRMNDRVPGFRVAGTVRIGDRGGGRVESAPWPRTSSAGS